MTEELLQNLIRVKKVISVQPNRNFRVEGAHSRKEFECKSEDGGFSFKVFIRYHNHFQENFSVGLIYVPKDGSGKITILRCNGQHGPHLLWDHHNKFHIHTLDTEELSDGVHSERNAIITDQYHDVYSAIQYFVGYVNIVNPPQHLTHYTPIQTNLF